MYTPNGKYISFTTVTKNIWEWQSNKTNKDRVAWYFTPVEG